MAFNLARFAPTGTIEHVLAPDIVLAPEIDPKPVVLMLKYAGKANERFAKAVERAKARGNTDRDTWLSILARTVLVDWRHVYEDGKPVAFSPEGALKLFEELIDAGRDRDLNNLIERAADPEPFAARDDLGKE